jgi:hypothetical protein
VSGAKAWSFPPCSRHGIGAVILGPTDGKGRAIILQGLGVDGKEHDEVIGQQGREHRAAGGFDADGHPAVAKAIPQLGHPFMDGLGGLLQAHMFGFGPVGRVEPQVMFLVGPIQTDGGREVGGCIHNIVGF